MSPSKSSQVTLSYGAYKPVPPPKPLPGYSTAPSVVPQEPRMIDSILGAHPGFKAFHQDENRGMPALDHILVTDQGHFHTHSTKFPIATDTEKLLSNLRYSGRFSEGIENPALIHDAPSMQLYSTPQKNFEGRPTQQDLSSPHYARMTAFETGEMMPSYALNHNPNSPNVHRVQRKLYHVGPSMGPAPAVDANAIPRSIQDQTRHVTFHPQPGYSDHSHLNGGLQNGTNLNDSNAGGYYIPQQLTNGTPGMRPNGHVASSHYQSQLENRLNSECVDIPYSIHSQSPNKPKSGEIVNGRLQVSDSSHKMANGIVHADTINEPDKKDDKWGSLKLAGKKYSHFKNIFSNKFSKTESKPHEQMSNEAHTNFSKVMNSQGTNTSAQNHKETPQNRVEPPKFEGRPNSLNASFHKAVRYSTLKDGQEDHPPRKEKEMPTAEARKENANPLTSPSMVRNLPHFHRGEETAKDRISIRENLPIQGYQNEASFPRKSGSCGQLAQEQSWRQIQHQQQSGFPWSHKSSENLNRALPSDHAYPDDRIGGSHLSVVREGRTSGGSDSGRGTGGSGGERESKSHDTSLESGSSTRNPRQQSHSSGNESEWIDIPDEMQKLSLNIREEHLHRRATEGGNRRDEGSSTPPLPLLSPEPSPKICAKPFSKAKRHSNSFSSSANKPDLLEAAELINSSKTAGTVSSPPQKAQKQTTKIDMSSSNRENLQRSTSLLPSATQNWNGKAKSNSTQESHKDRVSQLKAHPKAPSSIPYRFHGDIEDELTSTDAALDLNSVLDGATEATSDDELTSIGGEPDTYLIRKQLEGLEGMYSEVLKLLGGKPKPHIRRRLHGSLSSLPSSITSGRIGGNRDRKGRVLDDRLKRVGKESSKSTHKRFQRLESHVVTLARSVAHLSSEMRTQHMMFQEIESIKADLAAMKSNNGAGNSSFLPKNFQDMPSPWNLAMVGATGLSNPGRVKKLTNFFGDEPPLVRIFLRKLGYEKYAGVFEQEKIGMLELPYLTEERLQKIGIPLGPRIRILQEAQGPIRREGNLSVYVV